MTRRILDLIGLFWLALLPALQPAAAPWKIVTGKTDAKTARGNREWIEAGLVGGNELKLPAGEVWIDRALLLGPQHSGGTLRGVGPQSVLVNKFATANGVNNTVSLDGRGVNYVAGSAVTPDGKALILADTIPGTPTPWDDPSAQTNLLKPGNTVYCFIYNSFTGERKRSTIRSFDAKTRRLELADKPDPKLPAVKWLDGSPIADVKAGDRVIRMTDAATASGFAAGRYVYVTDGPSRANEATGEHRRVLTNDPVAGTVTLDEPVSRAYTLAALARLDPVAGFTFSRLTLAQPLHPQANPFAAKWCVDLRLDRVRAPLPDDTPYTGVAFGSSARVTIADCEVFNGVGLNGCHDVLVDGGEYASIHGEEASTLCNVRNCTIRANPRQLLWAPHGITWDVGSDRLKVERVRIDGFGPHVVMGQTFAVESHGPGLVLRDVTVVSAGWPQAALSLNAGTGTLDRVSSDGPVYFWNGQGYKVDDSTALFFAPKPGTTGTITASTPTPAPAPGWVVR